MAVITDSEYRPRFMDRGELSHAEVQDLAEYTARELLGISADEAFTLLDRGEFDGKGIEPSLRALHVLLTRG